MSATADLCDAVYDILAADTGAGGLLETGSPMVNAVRTMQVPQGTALPYVVLQPVSGEDLSTFASLNHGQTMQISIFTSRDGGLAKTRQVSARLRTLLRRVVPTVSGWTVSPGSWTERTLIIDDDAFHQVIEAEYVMTGA